MAMFKGFKPQGLQKIASKMGYAGRMEEFDSYLEQNPEKQREMITYSAKAQEMARGGVVRKFAEGGNTGTPLNEQLLVGAPVLPPTENPIYGGPALLPKKKTPAYTPIDQSYVPTLGTGEGQVDAYGDVATTTYDEDGNAIEGTRPASVVDITGKLAQTGAIPVGAVTQPQLTPQTEEQFIDPTTGKLADATDATVTEAGTTDASTPEELAATKYTAGESKASVEEALLANEAAQTDPDDPKSKVIAAEQTTSSVSDLTAAKGSSILLENPVQRKIEDGELISGAADAETASAYTEQIQAATATPSDKATVAGQLATLTADFDASNPPPWAAGTLRAVQAQMAARGLGASSMAGQAMIQGALESALPIAQADATTNASFEAQNLSNRQARAMLAAEQRATFIGQEFDQAFQARVKNSASISDIANLNFTAEQSIALENSKNANTMNLQNLSNDQALVMAEAAALSQLEVSSLSNRQQAAVQNAKNFLELDLANLSNEQQTALFNAEKINASILTDTAAKNAAAQFNATSDDQTNQFMATLASNVSKFNATQANAQAQFNAGEANTIEKFNAEVNNQRDQFNATNQITIAQNNAVWRREIATADTAAVNRSNELNAKAVLDTSNTQYNNLWNYYADTMEWAWKSAESEQDRVRDLVVANLDAEGKAYAAKLGSASQGGSAIGSLIGTLGGAYLQYGFSKV